MTSFNIRLSTRARKISEPSLHFAMRDNGEQRCLVVTDGFYEWKKLDRKGKLSNVCHDPQYAQKVRTKEMSAAR
jgi:putative SOS response-associated peptidase YedK